MKPIEYITMHWDRLIFGAIFIFALYKLFRYRGLFESKVDRIVGDELDEHEKYIS